LSVSKLPTRNVVAHVDQTFMRNHLYALKQYPKILLITYQAKLANVTRRILTRMIKVAKSSMAFVNNFVKQVCLAVDKNPGADRSGLLSWFSWLIPYIENK
jgi:hypothetical protein